MEGLVAVRLVAAAIAAAVPVAKRIFGRESKKFPGNPKKISARYS